MSTAVAEGPPQKKFRIDVPTEVVVDEGMFPVSHSSSTPESSPDPPPNQTSSGQPVPGEVEGGQSPGAPSSARNCRSSNGSSSSTSSTEKEEEDAAMAGSILEMISKSLVGGGFKMEEGCEESESTSPKAPPIPGALAVAQSPAAQLFANDDWSWHRNPAAAIRSGGTNKQTPVWKYFVYNKVENLSRCIIDECTYMLKGPHTSTLACHLKKHPKEYAEYQKLKVNYQQDKQKMEFQMEFNRATERQNSVLSPSSTSISSSMETSKASSVKKENGSSLASALRPPAMPNLMQNLLGLNGMNTMTMNSPMNPIHQMILNQQVPCSAANMNVSQASQMLQQAGLTVSASGQIVQSKKWRRDERRQRELESRLSLALAVSHLDFQVLRNPLWKELLECAQPRFTFSDDVHTYNQIIAQHHSRLLQTMRAHLNSSKKVCLVVEGVRVTQGNDDVTQRLCVSATFPAFTAQKYEMQSLLLAFRPLVPAETQHDSINSTVEQILNEFDIPRSKISRIVRNVKELYGEEEEYQTVDKEIPAFAVELQSIYESFLYGSAAVEELRKAVFALIFSIVTRPEALQSLNKAVGGSVDLPLTEPFPVLAEAVLRHKEPILNIQTDSQLTEQQWNLLRAVSVSSGLFRQALGDRAAGIDSAIATLKQIVMALKNDEHLSSVREELLPLVEERMRFVTDPEHENFQAAFVEAAALNPQMAPLLNDKQLKHAKMQIEKQLSSRVRTSSRPLGMDSLLANVMQCGDHPLYSELIQQAHQRMQQDTSPVRDRMVEATVSTYFEEVLNGCSVENLLSGFPSRPFGNPLQPPLLFWHQCAAQCPQFAELALEVLSIPLAATSVADLLSLSPKSPWHTPDYSLVLSNMDAPERLERDLLLRINHQLLPKTY